MKNVYDSWYPEVSYNITMTFRVYFSLCRRAPDCISFAAVNVARSTDGCAKDRSRDKKEIFCNAIGLSRKQIERMRSLHTPRTTNIDTAMKIRLIHWCPWCAAQTRKTVTGTSAGKLETS